VYFIPYNKSLREFSQLLRNYSTLGEVLLWNELKQSKLLGYKFNRQKPIGRYIVDFYCKPLNLVIEVDGSIHDEEEVRLNDAERQMILESLGISFLRFEDVLVRKHMDQVLRDVEDWIKVKEEAGFKERSGV
jgi:very-short-patch-repair endonuclease